MKDIKDRNQKEEKQGVQNQERDPLKQEEEEEYHFLREVIKEKPVDKRKIGYIAGGVLVCAVMFGVVAAFTFVREIGRASCRERV